MNKKRINISSNAPWEEIVGYSRAVRIGPFISVAGTTATDDNGNIVGINNPYEQTIKCIKNIEIALNKAGAELSDVIRTRIYVINIDDWEIIGKAHGEFFKNIKPAATMVEVKRLIAPEVLVEIEADAYIEEN